MNFKIKFQQFIVERVSKGKSNYEKGVVTFNEGKSYTIVSFANPDVFATLKKANSGEEYMVETVQDGAYTKWSKITLVGENMPNTGTKAAAPSAPIRSTYETPEERAKKQVYIVRQSSLAQAVATLLPGAKAALDPGAVKALAEDYTSWVLGAAPEQEDEFQDIPV